MNKKIKYNKSPNNISNAIKSSIRIKDFLPPPEQLIKKNETIRITINLNKQSVTFFKKKARKHGVPYQSMIKSVLDFYVHEYK